MRGAVLTRNTTHEERRRLSLDTARVQIRAFGDTGGPERFNGYAAVFNQRTAIGNPLKWGFYEQIAPGAFTKTLQEGDARFLIDHDSYHVVARVSANTLTLGQDMRGLSVDAALDVNLSYVNDLIANVRNGNITGMSFGFSPVKDDWQVEEVRLDDGTAAEVEVRTLLEVKLPEVSSVTFPAYETTSAELNSVATALAFRGNVEAIEKRAFYKPELLQLLKFIELEPAESTRADETDSEDHDEPAASTQSLAPGISDRMRVLAARYHLPAA